MSSLSCGIVGLPNVGKSTLFNALLKRQQAYVANFPFATIEPNIGVVPVPDNRLKQLAQVVKESENLDHFPPEVPATIQFVDIAGLIAGAHKGEGLGNKFLSHIREVDAICHVIRDFEDEQIIKEGSTDPKTDFEVVETELILADLQTIEKQKDPGMTSDKELKAKWGVVTRLRSILETGKPARTIIVSNEDRKYIKELSLLTSKPILVVVNVSEDKLLDSESIEKEYANIFGINTDQVIVVCAKTEAELAGLSEAEQSEYLKSINVAQSGLDKVIKKAFSTLGLITFLTAGEKEVRAWTVKKDTIAPDAAGVIHTDFQNNFIKADVVSFNDFVYCKGWKMARELGKVCSEGRNYLIRDGDVVEYKVNP